MLIGFSDDDTHMAIALTPMELRGLAQGDTISIQVAPRKRLSIIEAANNEIAELAIKVLMDTRLPDSQTKQ